MLIITKYVAYSGSKCTVYMTANLNTNSSEFLLVKAY